MTTKLGKCQICGRIDALTKEHLPQRALYPKSIRPLVKNLNTVAACAECNNSSNVVDELLKVIVGLFGDAPWTEELRTSTELTLSKNQRLSRLVDENTHIENYKTESGDIAQRGVLKLPKELTAPLIGTVERMVKALFYQHFKKVLVEHYEISVFHREGLHPEVSQRIYESLSQARIHSINNNTVRYCFASVNSTDIVSVINIYGNLEFFFVLKELGWRGRVGRSNQRTSRSM